MQRPAAYTVVKNARIRVVVNAPSSRRTCSSLRTTGKLVRMILRSRRNDVTSRCASLPVREPERGVALPELLHGELRLCLRGRSTHAVPRAGGGCGGSCDGTLERKLLTAADALHPCRVRQLVLPHDKSNLFPIDEDYDALVDDLDSEQASTFTPPCFGLTDRVHLTIRRGRRLTPMDCTRNEGPKDADSALLDR